MIGFILLGFAVLGLTGALGLSVKQHKIKAAAKRVKAVEKTRSVASTRIINLYDSLPEESRRIDRAELIESLEALDFKHSITSVNGHFSYQARYDSRLTFNWDCVFNDSYDYYDDEEYDNEVVEHVCNFKEYLELNNAMKAVQEAAEAKEAVLVEAKRQAELAGRQASIDKVSILTERLRAEAGVLNEVAKEFTV